MKRTALRKKGKAKISVIQRKLWELCRQVALKRYADDMGRIDCYTCEVKDIQGSNRQLGHMLAKASVGAYLKYDLRVLRWQCMRCNQFLGGQGAIFIEKMRQIEGDEYVDQILQDRNKTVKAYDHYLMLLDEYEKLL